MRLNSNIKGVKVKPIPNSPEYLASFDGRVYSTKLHRWLSTNPHKIFGYLQVHLRKKTHRLNRVIATTWIPNPDNLPCVGHKDNNRTNNRVENLYWCTHKENTQQCIRDGRFKPRGKTPLSIEIRRKIKAEYLKGNTTLQKLSRKYGRAHSVIRRIVYETK